MQPARGAAATPRLVLTYDALRVSLIHQRLTNGLVAGVMDELARLCRPPKTGVTATEGDVDDFFTFRLSVLNGLVTRQGERVWFDRFNLSTPQRRLLLSVGTFPNSTLAEISRITQTDKGQISRSGRELVDRGLLDARADTADGRLKRFSLTLEGRLEYESVLAESRRRQVTILDCLSADERQDLFRLFAKLTSHIVTVDQLQQI